MIVLDGRVLDSIIPVIVGGIRAFLSKLLVVGMVRVFKVVSTVDL
jgi:hypothetical protein